MAKKSKLEKVYKVQYEDGYYYTWKEGSIHYNEKGEGYILIQNNKEKELPQTVP